MGVAHAAGVCAAVYLLGRDGISLRDGVLIGCSAVYLLRYLLTAFFLLQRGVDWAEAAQVGPFLFALQAFFGFLGSRSSVPWHWVDCIAVSLYVVGSFLNTASELQRKRWKGSPTTRATSTREASFPCPCTSTTSETRFSSLASPCSRPAHGLCSFRSS